MSSPAPNALDSGRFVQFFGGLRLPGHKRESTSRPIAQGPIPPRLILPLQQHIGAPAAPLVKVGEEVLKGQLIAHPQGSVSAGVHASSSGRVAEITEHAILHPSGLAAPCVIIETDGRDRAIEASPGQSDYLSVDPAELRERVRAAGIVGMGGAGFPTDVKLNPELPIHTLIVNGAECEPYISCDDMLMRERAETIVTGALILKHILDARTCLIGIEDNKPEAIEALRAAVDQAGADGIQVQSVPTVYPAGGEKQLIHVLTGQEVLSEQLPATLGMVCQNVATTAAVAEAVISSQPLISRIVTVTGQGIARPGNLEVRIGTPIADLLAAAGGRTPKASSLIMGGPMMGIPVSDEQAPVIKTTNCLLLPSTEEIPPAPPARPCIRCGECSRVCPVNLLPFELYWHARARELDKAQDYDLFDCIECGCCNYVCPSHIQLVDYFRFAKTEIWEQERERRKADLARRRHEARQARLERAKAEKAARQRKKAAALKAVKGEKEDPKQAAIRAALERVRAKQAQQPRNTEDLTEAQRRKIAEIEARRRVKRGEAAGTENKANPQD